MKKLEINNNLYEMDNATAQKTLDGAKSLFKNKNSIYAIEKEDLIVMLNETFKKEKMFLNAVKDYKKEGFKVYYTTQN